MTNKTETVREVCAEYTQPNHTCRNCEFVVCPVIDVFAGKVLAAHECELAEKDAEIARLKAALKPVMNLDMSRFGFTVDYGECFNAVRESQRIVGAWDDKNYFDKENNNAKL